VKNSLLLSKDNYTVKCMRCKRVIAQHGKHPNASVSWSVCPECMIEEVREEPR